MTENTNIALIATPDFDALLVAELKAAAKAGKTTVKKLSQKKVTECTDRAQAEFERQMEEIEAQQAQPEQTEEPEVEQVASLEEEIEAAIVPDVDNKEQEASQQEPANDADHREEALAEMENDYEGGAHIVDLTQIVPKPVVVQKAAPVQKAASPRMSKKQIAGVIFRDAPAGMARKDIINQMMAEAGLSKAGASTYYHNFNSRAWDLPTEA